MLLLKLVKETSSKVVYNYFPEQKEHFGTVAIDKTTGEVTDVQISINDKHERYMHHALSRIVEFFENGTYKDQDVVAWN